MQARRHSNRVAQVAANLHRAPRMRPALRSARHPRLLDLIQDSQRTGGILVVEAKHHERPAEWTNAVEALMERIKSTVPSIKMYPPDEELTCFARNLANDLQC